MSEETLLLCSLGTSDYDETISYRFADGRSAETQLFPLALADILDIDTAVIAYTETVESETDHLQALNQGFREADVDSSRVKVEEIDPEIQDDTHPDESVMENFERVVTELKERNPDRVVVDITYGFRSLQFVFFASVIQLDAIDDVELAGIYYGKYYPSGDTSDNDDPPTAPIIDLTALSNFIDWYHALRSFQKTKSLRPVTILLTEHQDRFLNAEAADDDGFGEIVNNLDAASQSFNSGLPLDAGLNAEQVLDDLDNVGDDPFVGPSFVLLDPLEQELKKFTLTQQATTKSDVELTEDELNRQQQLVRFYRDTDRYWIALQCARELFVNHVLFADPQPIQQQWLDEDTRDSIRNKLSANAAADGETADAYQLWRQLERCRDRYSNAGFVKDDHKNRSINSVLKTLFKNVNKDEFWAEIV